MFLLFCCKHLCRDIIGTNSIIATVPFKQFVTELIPILSLNHPLAIMSHLSDWKTVIDNCFLNVIDKMWDIKISYPYNQLRKNMYHDKCLDICIFFQTPSSLTYVQCCCHVGNRLSCCLRLKKTLMRSVKTLPISHCDLTARFINPDDLRNIFRATYRDNWIKIWLSFETFGSGFLCRIWPIRDETYCFLFRHSIKKQNNVTFSSAFGI